MFVGDALYGKVDRVPGVFYVATRFLHFLWIPLVPRESYLIRDDETDIAVRIPLSAKSILLAWLRTALLLGAMTFTVGGVAFVRAEPQAGKAPPVAIALGLWLCSCGMGGAYLLTHGLSRARPQRARELGALIGLTRDDVDDLYVANDPVAAEAPARAVVAEIASDVREMSAATFEAAGEATAMTISMTLFVGVSLLCSCIALATGIGLLALLEMAVGRSPFAMWSVAALLAGAPPLLFVGRRPRTARGPVLGESRTMWLAIGGSAWAVGALLAALAMH